MPRDIMNWLYRDVVELLESNYFVRLSDKGGSHRYFRGNVDGVERLVEVQYHAGESFKPKTLKDGIAHSSGIPIQFWKDWARLGKKARKNIYKGSRIP
jgi:predicted RNA binding protein YcfA (HicA-like mRNA interferase family)